jgi:hypothetical protein
VSVQDRCTLCAKHTQKLFWMHLIVHLGDEAHVEICFGPFGDSAHLDTRLVHVLCRTYQRLRKSFWKHPMELLGDEGHVESCFGPFGDSVSVGVR